MKGVAFVLMMSVALCGCEAVVAFFRGFSETGAAQQRRRDCRNDYDCGEGAACVKRQYEPDGVCMQKVDEYGNATHSAPDPSSYEVGHEGICASHLDCPPGFLCALNGPQRGNCVK